MTSSRRSKSSVSRRALYLAGDKATVYHWSGGRLTGALVFDATDAGLVQFNRYLEESPGLPIHLLVDVVEEDYRQETIPHVFGSDREALIKRKMQRLFRGTPYCYASVQGRESSGRKDDRVLMMALTNPDIIAPWAALLKQHKTPLAGIHSLPMVSGQLLGRMGITSKNLLLVSIQSASGLRQSFFRDQRLQLSRLAKMPRLGTVPYGPYLLGEVEKIRRYLNSLRLLVRDQPLDICILSHGDLLRELRRQCVDSEMTRYAILDVEDVARRIGLRGGIDTPYSDAIFAQLLLSKPGENHYALPEERSYYQLYRTRLGMLAASLVLLLGGTVWSGFNFIEGLSLHQEGIAAAQKADFYQARFQMAREGLPATPVEPADLRSAVEIADTLGEYRTTPLDLMRVLSQALNAYPRLQVDEIDWMASPDPARPFQQTGQPQETLDMSMLASAQESYRYYQIALVKGRVAPFDGNYRQALAAVNRFAETLRAQPGMYYVKVLSLPLDVSSEARLQGSATDDPGAAKATFSIKVILGIGDEKV